MSLLRKINGPQDIKKLNPQELNLLAREIRAKILSTVSKNGGHLAPSLGVVELTLALHRVFDTHRDRLVWDVGHQAYAHKIITGRRDFFCTLRQFGGLSGFPKGEESVHDAFNTGHSSTSISAALGFALAREHLKESYRVIAVIGDGAMTGGEAFEALNQAGHLGVNMLVVLNDNEMSIAKNVGALSSYLSRLRSDPMYTKRKRDVEYILNKIPAIGPSMVKAVERVKDSLKYLLVPGVLFEELGFTYLGPIDGHNIQEMTAVLKKTKNVQGPVVVHVITQKGRGYTPAVNNPDVYHGVGPFDIKTGQVVKTPGPPTYTSVFSNTLLDLAARDSRIVAVTAAMPDGTGLKAFAHQYPRRFFDVGIAEQNAVTLSAAMALKGLRPVVAIYSTFLQRAYDQVVHDVCLQKAPVLLAIDRAGLVGEDGPTHHGVFDISFLRHIPGLAVLAPKDEEELRHMIYTALQHEGPSAIRFPRGRGIGVGLSQEYQALPWGKGEVLSVGNDLVIFAVGVMVYPALAVKSILEARGLTTTVINARFISPIDEALLLDAARKHPLVVTLEENVLAGGFGSAVLELAVAHGLNTEKWLNIGVPNEFIPHGDSDVLRDRLGLSPEKMAERIAEHFCLPSQKRTRVTLSFVKKQ